MVAVLQETALPYAWLNESDWSYPQLCSHTPGRLQSYDEWTLKTTNCLGGKNQSSIWLSKQE